MTPCPVCGTLPAQSGEPNCWCPPEHARPEATRAAERPAGPFGGKDSSPTFRGPQNGDAVSPKPRLRACVETWPECHTFGYDPRCCRFPKSCSCDVYDDEYVTPDDLEPQEDQ